MSPAPDPAWAAEEERYWRIHHPAYVPYQGRMTPLPPPAYLAAGRVAVQVTPAPEPPPAVVEVAPRPAAAPAEPPQAPARAAARWTCADCGGPRQTARSARCNHCGAKAAAAARYVKRTAGGEPGVEPVPLHCPDCGAASPGGRRCHACKMARFWAGGPRPVGQAAAVCPDCGDSIARGSSRCRQCAQRRRFAGRPRVPEPLCPDCGARVSRPGVRCRPCAGVALSNAAPAQGREPRPRELRCPDCRQPSTTGARCRRCSHAGQAVAARARRIGREVAALAPAGASRPGGREASLDLLVAQLAAAAALRTQLQAQAAALYEEIAHLETELARRQAARKLPASVPRG